MKKLLITLLAVLSCGAAYALPVGNPAEASMLCDGLFWDGDCSCEFWDFWCNPCCSWCDAFSFRAGFYGDYVFNRHLEVDNSDPKRDIEHTELYTSAGYIVLNLFNRFDIFTSLGASNMYITSNALSFDGAALQNDRIEIESETDFSWSIGARLTLWECGCTTVGIEGQYFQFCPDINRITTAATESIYPDSSGIDFRYYEWQVGVGVAHKIHMLTPYMAVKWSGAKWMADNAEVTVGSGSVVTLHDLENKKIWGYVLGVSLVDCEKMMVTAEGRWADEKAVYVNGQIRF